MSHDFWTFTGLFLLTFISEDTATLGGAYLALADAKVLERVFLACFLGIWAGDLVLYFLGRYCGRPLANRILGNKKLAGQKINQSELWFQRYGMLSLVISRFVPGMRLPTYLSAGFLKMPALPFICATGVLAALWVTLLFCLVHRLGATAPGVFHQLRQNQVLAVCALLAFVILLHFLMRGASSMRCRQFFRKLWQWEFWPAWFFYLPVVANFLRLSIRYGSISLPTSANPGMLTGGIIGESKFDTLDELQTSSPEFVAASYLLTEEGDRMGKLQSLLIGGKLEYPFVLKPDVGQRGSGFKVIHREDQARAYLSLVDVPIVAQQYIAGPFEAGVFYYRFPNENMGRILAMTEKIFPVIEGDGSHTIAELIRADKRASLLAETYLTRFQDSLGEIPPSGQSVRLVEAGNHAQGCIFLDGMYLWSSELESRIDEISQKINGFFVGRYDLRFSSAEELTKGNAFWILELNGASSEPTSAYDASKSLADAYGLLFKQWNIVFAIAAQNRALGHQSDAILSVLSEWRKYRLRSICHPAAD